MTYRRPRIRLLLACLFVSVVLSTAAFADAEHERTQVGNNITIGPDEQVREATCFGCSIRVRGQVAGDVTAFGGSIVVEEQGQVGGDATTFGGDIRIDKAGSVARDVTVFGGRIRRDSAARVGGDVTNMGGPGWMVLIFLTPFIFLGLFVALIVWVVRRLLRPAVPVTA
jgi:hypothetical protein